MDVDRDAQAYMRYTGRPMPGTVDANEKPAKAPISLFPRSRREDPWPEPLDRAALHGIVGEIAKQIEPETEADEAAIIVQTLVAAGALIGRGPHVAVEGDEHHANIYALLVGATANGRKGTSWGRVREIFSRATDWPRVVEGLSSGEGLKFNVRDPTEKDPGVIDKRLLVVESEFSQVLRQVARAGNTLSATVRSAWDKGELATLTKNDPITATGAHICIVGHITVEELRSELTATDQANGFANRFIFQAVKRSKSLAFGGRPLPVDVVNGFAQRLAHAAGQAKIRGRVEMNDSAREAWAAAYPTLSEGEGGLLGAVTARSAPQCLRLALIYALLDESPMIDSAHVLAALAVWERSEQSAKHIFGAAIGDPVADEILRQLKTAKDGLTRTAISKIFSGHKSAEQIGVAMDRLERLGRARREERETGGAPAEVWVRA